MQTNFSWKKYILDIRFTWITSFASITLPSFKQIANKLSRVESICDTTVDVVLVWLFLGVAYVELDIKVYRIYII